jgi:DNA modification methylase
MASHWKTSQIPTPEQWAKLRAHFTTPWRFEAGVKADARVYRSNASDAQRVVVGRDDKPDHSSPKPLGVMRWLVDRLTFPGDMIVDPFAGSGSTLVAAKQLGRSAIGVEIDEHHCEVAAMRLSQGTLVFAELWGFERDRTEEAAEAGR